MAAPLSSQTIGARPGRLSSLAVLLVCSAACTGNIKPSSLRAGRIQLRLIGEVVVVRESGEIELRLVPAACTQEHRSLYWNGNVKREVLPCETIPRRVLESVRLTSPWGQTLAPAEGRLETLVFAVTWDGAGIDPLAQGASDALKLPWRFESPDALGPVLWNPDESQRTTMLFLIGEATDTQTAVVNVTEPPQIEVTDFHASSELRNGASAELVLTVTNRGAGDAYRLSATTRSNVPALHGLRFSFGQVGPGKAKTRRVKVNLPRDNDESEATVVLVFDEAHRFGPAQTTKRYRVHPAADVAILALTCQLGAVHGGKTEVDAGQTVQAACTVRNAGASARGLRLRATITGRPGPTDSAPFDLAIDASTSVTLAVDVPRNAGLDSELTMTLQVIDDDARSLAQTTLQVVIVRPQICPDGKLTRKEFGEKRAKLRRALEGGLISKEDYDRYEAELVGCLE